MTIVPTLAPNERQLLYTKLADKLETAYNLNRKIVSFQANKGEPFYRWFKYKEGFSSSLVKYFLTEYGEKSGKLLDPFAGAGTTLFAGQEMGWQSYGIELLPVGVFAMYTREALQNIDIQAVRKAEKTLWQEINKIHSYDIHISHVSITKDAFPEESEVLLNKYLTYCSTIKDQQVQALLRFVAFSVLEDISYTRKDGQYLRWDYRTKRQLIGKIPFDKGRILTFEDAINNKLHQICDDLSPKRQNSLFELCEEEPTIQDKLPLNIVSGSCLEEIPRFEDGFFDFIITSPPYCNRYDYTRTYALELIFLQQNNEQIRDLRQSLLSCTVENKEKLEYLHQFYSSIGRQDSFDAVIEAYSNCPAMIEVNSILDGLNKLEELNNKNIPRMVKNYFLELCFVIYEMARVTKSGGYCVMVNDNVRYGGEEIPVDLILSEFAENFDFNINKIFVLPKGKGNSSQQMGNYGRTEVRKCVYLWQKR